jgi:hypothetical protein
MEDDFKALKRFNVRIELFGFMFVASCVTGTYQDRIVAAMNTAALSVESAETTSEMLYETQQELVLDLSGRETPLPTQSVVQARLAVVRTTWDPLWAEFDAIRVLYERVATALVEGAKVDTLGEVATEQFERQKVIADMLKKLREDYLAMKKRDTLLEELK